MSFGPLGIIDPFVRLLVEVVLPENDALRLFRAFLWRYNGCNVNIGKTHFAIRLSTYVVDYVDTHSIETDKNTRTYETI